VLHHYFSGHAYSDRKISPGTTIAVSLLNAKIQFYTEAKQLSFSRRLILTIRVLSALIALAYGFF